MVVTAPTSIGAAINRSGRRCTFPDAHSVEAFVICGLLNEIHFVDLFAKGMLGSMMCAPLATYKQRRNCVFNTVPLTMYIA